MSSDDAKVKRILGTVKKRDIDVLSELGAAQSYGFRDLWVKHVELYRGFTEKLIDAGHYAKAFDLAREGLENHKADRPLMYWRALALARGKNRSKASEYLEVLLGLKRLNRRLRSEALSLAGRLKKELYHPNE